MPKNLGVISDGKDTPTKDYADAHGPVTDVQVNGTSVLNNGVANIPQGTAYDRGVFLLATTSDFKSGQSTARVVTPAGQDRSIFYGLAKAAGDSTQSASSNAAGVYTEDAKSKISDMLNAPVSVSGSTPTITAKSGVQYICGEVSTLAITVPKSGCFDVVFDSGSTATVLSFTLPTGYTKEWANGFDDTALDANTTYEINIMIVGTKCLGVACAWA